MAPSRSMVGGRSLGVVSGGKREFCAYYLAVLSSSGRVERVKTPAPPLCKNCLHSATGRNGWSNRSSPIGDGTPEEPQKTYCSYSLSAPVDTFNMHFPIMPHKSTYRTNRHSDISISSNCQKGSVRSQRAFPKGLPKATFKYMGFDDTGQYRTHRHSHI